jgi:hypothetical protein
MEHQVLWEPAQPFQQLIGVTNAKASMLTVVFGFSMAMAHICLSEQVQMGLLGVVQQMCEAVQMVTILVFGLMELMSIILVLQFLRIARFTIVEAHPTLMGQ